MRKQDQRASFTVFLRAGTYRVNSPVVFDESDSGSESHPVTYRNYEGEQPVVSGCLPIIGWTPHQNGILKAALPQIERVKDGVIQVFEDSVPGTLARSPNEGWFRLADPHIEPGWSFRYKDGDFDPSGMDVSQLAVHLIQMGTYFSEHIPIKCVDATARRLHTEFKMHDAFYNPVNGKCYTIENALGLLDAPGEFFADRQSKILYYMPMANGKANANIVADTAAGLIRVQGKDKDNPAHDISFEGIQFEGSRTQLALLHTLRIAVRDCRFLYAGDSAISISGGSTFNTVEGCEIAGPGNNGIAIHGEYTRSETGPATVHNHHHTIYDNHIHHVGRNTITGCGIAMYSSANDNSITHNLITDAPKSGIIMFSMWDIPRELGIMNNNAIANNEIARCVSSSWDGGAFYIGATTENNRFENNRICDVWSWFNATWPQPEDRPEDVCSIDFDPGMTFNTHIRNNAAFGANAMIVEFGRYEDETMLENNYFESPGHPDEILVNGKWEKNPRFDASKVAPDIGLTTQYKFLYPKEIIRPINLPVRCGFEGTLSPFYLYRYSDGLRHEYIANSNVHAGGWTLQIDKDVVVARYTHPQPIPAKVTVWMYDDRSKTNATCTATLRGPAAIEEAVIALGVHGSISPSYYVVQEWQDRITPTAIPRTTGWHKLTFDIHETDHHNSTPHNLPITEISLDDKPVAQIPTFKSFTTIDLGDSQFNTDSRGLRFDSVSVE
ncbi:MAG: hypothetical protein AMXMBFR84_05850 [Candidatus Hydrogenedentota bacterium]